MHPSQPQTNLHSFPDLQAGRRLLAFGGFDTLQGGSKRDTFNLLHLFGQEQRSSIASWFYKTLRQEGVLVLTSMSLRDPDFGKGEEVGYHTFESKKGRPVFYFDQEDMRHLFQRGFQILRLEEIQEHEDHGGKEHFHWMWFLAAKKV